MMKARSTRSFFGLLATLKGLATGTAEPIPLYNSFFGVPGADATFDYVIAGGGTAGLAVAARLAERSLSVAVIEAGGFYETDNGNLSVVPGYASYFSGTDPKNFQPLIDWGIVTSEQKGAGRRRMHYARGKTLGGSSARNYMLYHRPTFGTMKKWAEDVGDDSYTWENMLPYFQKSVNYTAPDPGLYTNVTVDQDPNAFSPDGGPLHVSFSNAVDPFGTWVGRALAKAGIPTINGLSSGRLIGAGYTPSTIHPEYAERQSSESSFLRDALRSGRAPVVYKNTLATKILFDGNQTAIGLTAITAGTFGTPSVSFTLKARKEVIVSAGAFQSPQLLMVSGVGHCGELAEFNITCVKHLPGVGKNMWDHPVVGVAHRVHVNTASASANNATLAYALVNQYLTERSGPLSINGPGIYGWEKLPEPFRSQLSNSTLSALASFPDDWPEIEYLPTPSYNGNYTNKQTADPRDGHNYATIGLGLISPISRGTVSLASPDMTTLPVVDPQWLTAKEDKELMLASFKRQRAVWAIFADLGVADREEAYPGPSVQTDEEILEWIASSVATVYHASSTCKMGKDDDPEAVVDSNAFVYGVKNLRVVDASSFPFLPPGHPQATVYAFAEKIAHEIAFGKAK